MDTSKLTPEEKITLARESRDFFWKKAQYAEDRSNKVSDSLRSTTLQVTALIFALLTAFSDKESFEQIPNGAELFGLGLIFLLVSIIFGFIGEINRRAFWNRISWERNLSNEQFTKVLYKNESLEEALAYQRGAMDGQNIQQKNSSNWAPIIQIIFLGFGSFLAIVMKFLSLQ